VTLAAGEGTYLHLLPPALRAFQRSRDTKLRVLTRDREQALSAVVLGEADLAVTVADEVPNSVLARPLLRVGASVVLPTSHSLARKRTLSIASLAGERLIVPPPGRPLRNALAHAFSEARVSFEPAIEVSGWELMLCFVELGLGIAVVNDFCKAPKGTVKRRLRGLPSVEYQLLRLRERPPSEAARALEHAICGEVKKR
jgi:DNA-binding transcriptional LysR family regulator